MSGALVLLLCLLFSCHLSGQVVQQNVASGERELFVELVYRYLGGKDSPGGGPRFFLGSLPQDIPVKVPLPSPAWIVGSIGRGDSVYIFLDVDQSSPAVLDFYDSVLRAEGWEALKRDNTRGYGGIIASPRGSFHTYCLSKRGPSLSVSAREEPGSRTQVRLSLHLDPLQSPCRPNSGPPGHLAAVPIPTLVAPESVRWFSGGGSGGSNTSRYTHSILESDLSFGQLLEHFAVQLKEEGWAKSGGSEQGHVAFSVWTREDDQRSLWQSLLIIYRIGSSNRIAVNLRTDLVETEQEPPRRFF